MIRLGLRWTSALAVVIVLGCGGSDRPTTYAVSGSVKYKGKPVEGATITFMAAGAARAAAGFTDAEGKFTLTTFDVDDGAVPGEHKVTITKSKAMAGGDMTAENPGEAYAKAMAAAGESSEAFAKTLENEIPVKYGNAETSGLVRTVTDGKNVFDFDLD